MRLIVFDMFNAIRGPQWTNIARHVVVGISGQTLKHVNIPSWPQCKRQQFHAVSKILCGTK